MTLYERYKRLGINLSQLGLGRGGAHRDYFCTPVGAEVIGWEGVDGVHYCFVQGFGGMVFAVSPANLPGDHVHPLARSFEDFLRLVLACGHTAALEQAHRWDRDSFYAFLEEEACGITPEQRAALDALVDGLGLTPMEDPYGCIREVQSGFDYSRLRFRPEYNRLVPEEPREHVRPEWKVYFDGNFGPRHQGRDRPGKEVRLDARFTWAGRLWHVPAVYLCGQGLVADFCMEVEPKAIRAFLEKWAPWIQGERKFTPEEQDQFHAEHPQTVSFDPGMEVNGKELGHRGGTGFGWVPVSCMPPEERSAGCQQTWEAIWLMEHYGLDPERGWMFDRRSFSWATKGKPALRTLKLRMSQYPQPVPGPRFTVHGPGDAVPFTHPVTGEAHTLHVVEYEPQTFPPEQLANMEDGEWEYPPCYTAMAYAVTPDLPRGAVSLQDCGQGDRPRRKAPPDPMGPTSALSVGIIAMSRRPAALTPINGSEVQTRAACSALRFRHTDEIQWRMTFYRKTVEDLEIDLPLPQS